MTKGELENKYTQAVMHKFEKVPRDQRRSAERELKDDFKIFHKFSDNQVEVVNRMVAYVANELAIERIDEIMDSINRCVVAYFNIRFEDMTIKELDQEFRVLDSLMEEDSRKIELLIKGCGGNKEMAKKKMTKSLEEIEVMCNELLDKGTKQKQAIEILEDKFKDIPKSILTNKFKEIKAEREVEEVEPDVVAAAEYIFPEIKEEKKEVTKVNTPKEVETHVQAKSKLKKVSEIFEGEFGQYVKTPEGVTAADKLYKDVESVDIESKDIIEKNVALVESYKASIEELNTKIDECNLTMLNVKAMATELKEVIQMA